jgi:hypothetical protein
MDTDVEGQGETVPRLAVIGLAGATPGGLKVGVQTVVEAKASPGAHARTIALVTAATRGEEEALVINKNRSLLVSKGQSLCYGNNPKLMNLH